MVTVSGDASFDPDGFIARYAWFEGETLLGTTPVLTTNLSTTGDHTLVLTVTDDDGVTRGDAVTVRVDQVEQTRVLTESFAAGFGAWARGGDVVLSSADPFPTAPQVRLGATGAFLRRTINLPSGSTGIALDFWAKASQFAAADALLVKVSVGGGPFTTIRTFTVADSTNAYIFYGGSAIPLGHSWFPATASTIALEFESRMTTGRFFVDDIKVTALVPRAGNQAPMANAGPDQTVTDSDHDGVEMVMLDGAGASDPDGSIVSYEWWEGTTLLGHGATLAESFGIGVHTVTLTVTDNGGAFSSDTVTVAVETRHPRSAWQRTASSRPLSPAAPVAGLETGRSVETRGCGPISTIRIPARPTCACGARPPSSGAPSICPVRPAHA